MARQTWLGSLGDTPPEFRALHPADGSLLLPLPQEGEAVGRRNLYFGIKAQVAKLAFIVLVWGVW